MALIQTRQGLPVGYELFAGNTTDVKTLEPAIAQLRARFAVDRGGFVADGERMSEENMALLLSQGYDYVVAARLRSMSAVHTKKVTGKPAWQETGRGRTVAACRVGGRRLIVRHGPRKAARDAHKRADALAKAKKRWADGVKGQGKAGRFLKVDQDAVRLNEDALRKDKQFDGLQGVWTSLEAEEPQQV